MPPILIKRMWYVVFMAALVVICGLGVYSGVANIRQASAQFELVQATNDRLDKENRALYRVILSLKQDPSALEKLCRSELGLVRPNEIVYLQP